MDQSKGSDQAQSISDSTLDAEEKKSFPLLFLQKDYFTEKGLKAMREHLSFFDNSSDYVLLRANFDSVLIAYGINDLGTIDECIEKRQQVIRDGFVSDLNDLVRLSSPRIPNPNDNFRIALGNFSRVHLDSFKKNTDSLETVMAAYNFQTAQNIYESIEWRKNILREGYVKNLSDINILSSVNLDNPSDEYILALTKLRCQIIDQYFFHQVTPQDPIEIYGLRNARSFAESIGIRFHIVNSGYVTTGRQLEVLTRHYNNADSGMNLVLDDHFRRVNRSYKTMLHFVRAGKDINTIENYFYEIPSEYNMSVFHRVSFNNKETILDKAKKYRDRASPKNGKKQRFEEIVLLLERLGPKK